MQGSRVEIQDDGFGNLVDFLEENLVEEVFNGPAIPSDIAVAVTKNLIRLVT